MRYPWAVGAGTVAWLSVSGVLARDTTSIVILWTLGLALLAICLAWCRPSMPSAICIQSASTETAEGATTGPTPSDPMPLPPPPSPAVPAMPSTSVSRSPRSTAPSASPHGLPRPPRAQSEDLRVWSSDEIAALLRIDELTIIESMQRGDLPGNQAGGHWRMSDASLRRWLDGLWAS
jgi:hypothetical protein